MEERSVASGFHIWIKQEFALLGRLRAFRGSLPGAESVRAASAGTADGPHVKRSFGCTEGVMSASLSAARRP